MPVVIAQHPIYIAATDYEELPDCGVPAVRLAPMPGEDDVAQPPTAHGGPAGRRFKNVLTYWERKALADNTARPPDAGQAKWDNSGYAE